MEEGKAGRYGMGEVLKANLKMLSLTEEIRPGQYGVPCCTVIPQLS